MNDNVPDGASFEGGRTRSEDADIRLRAARLASRLQLRRPLVFVDLETTGNDATTARVVEIAAMKLLPDGRTELRSRLANPETPIDPAATAVHGISDFDVQHEAPFRQFAVSLAEFIRGSDLAGFGLARFDLRVLESEFRRAGVRFSLDDHRIVDSLAIFFLREPRSLGAALKFYCDEEPRGLHRASADVEASLRVLDGQLEKYPDLPREIAHLDSLSGIIRPDPDRIDPEGFLVRDGSEIRVTFGKHRGRRLAEVADLDPGYLDWLLAADFSPEVKEVIRGFRA